MIPRRCAIFIIISYLHHYAINTSHYKAYLYDAQRHCASRQVQTRPGTSGHVHPPFALCTRSRRAPLACAARSSTLQPRAVRRCSSARLGSFLATSSFSQHSCCPPTHQLVQQLTHSIIINSANFLYYKHSPCERISFEN